MYLRRHGTLYSTQQYYICSTIWKFALKPAAGCKYGCVRHLRGSVSDLEEDLVHDNDGLLPEVGSAGGREGEDIVGQVSG